MKGSKDTKRVEETREMADFSRIDAPKGRPEGLCGTPDNFVGIADSLTFGVHNGKSFVLGEVKEYDYVKWAEANAMFYWSIAMRLQRFADVRKSEILSKSE
jgi:hypothetical protein